MGVYAAQTTNLWYNRNYEVAARDNFVIPFSLRPQTVLLPLFADVSY